MYIIYKYNINSIIVSQSLLSRLEIFPFPFLPNSCTYLLCVDNLL